MMERSRHCSMTSFHPGRGGGMRGCDRGAGKRGRVATALLLRRLLPESTPEQAVLSACQLNKLTTSTDNKKDATAKLYYPSRCTLLQLNDCLYLFTLCSYSLKLSVVNLKCALRQNPREQASPAKAIGMTGRTLASLIDTLPPACRRRPQL